MERVRWTDERLDERMTATDKSFERDFAELRAQREEMRAGFAQLHAEIAGLRADIVGLQRNVLSIMTSFVIALLGLIAAGQF